MEILLQLQVHKHFSLSTQGSRGDKDGNIDIAFNSYNLSLLALTKTEIRTLEGKLIKYFSKQLAARATLSQAQWQKVGDKLSQYPSLSQVSTFYN